MARGILSVAGARIDACQADYNDIIARSVRVNAGELTLTSGVNQVDVRHNTLTPLTGDDGSRPRLALDVESLGGMCAGKIHLTGTKAGVRNAGHPGRTQAGMMTVTADGRT